MSKRLSTLRILKGVRKLFENDETWTQGAGAKKQDGDYAKRVCEISEGTCFCLAGAIAKVNGYETWAHALQTKPMKVLEQVLPKKWKDDVVGWNDADNRTINQVRKLVDKAIAHVEAQQ